MGKWADTSDKPTQGVKRKSNGYPNKQDYRKNVSPEGIETIPGLSVILK